MGLHGFPNHVQGRSTVFDVVAEDLALAFQPGNGFALVHDAPAISTEGLACVLCLYHIQHPTNRRSARV